FHWSSLLQAPVSNLALITARDGAATASLGTLCQRLSNLTGKSFCLGAHLNLSSSRLKKLQTVGNLYIVSLSIADLIVGSAVMPLNIVYLLNSQWILGLSACLFWLSMDYVASTASIFNLFILCIDRYRSVQQPLKYLRYRTKRRASVMILGVWLLSFMWVIPILGWHVFANHGKRKVTETKCETEFSEVTWFKVLTAIVNFYIPSIMMLWFYYKIFRAVRKHCQHRELINGSHQPVSEKNSKHHCKMDKQNGSNPNHERAGSPQEKTENRDFKGLSYLRKTWQSLHAHSKTHTQGLHVNRERKAAKQLGVIMAAFMLCWIPYFVLFMVIAFHGHERFSKLHMFTICFSCLKKSNLFIYSFNQIINFFEMSSHPVTYCTSNTVLASSRLVHVNFTETKTNWVLHPGYFAKTFRLNPVSLFIQERYAAVSRLTEYS
uniref:Histamine H1 receptor n=1 Tax=Melopsittacus undulatus TaxID=13146 RepID=A0A8C6JPJ3_MELUD